MDKTKKARLTKKGWAFGSAESFLGLTPEESAYIEIKLSLARELKKARLKKPSSSQPRVAKMESADATRAWPDVAIPPGEVLAEELEARGLTQSRLARLMHRPLQAINEIVRGRKRITGATALGLADALGTSAEFWIRLEADYELNKARLARRREPRRRTRPRAPLGRAEAIREAALSSDPRFLKRVAAARRELRAGKGVRLEDLPR